MRATQKQIKEMRTAAKSIVDGKEDLIRLFKELQIPDQVLWKPIAEMGVSDSVRFAFFLLSFHEDDVQTNQSPPAVPNKECGGDNCNGYCNSLSCHGPAARHE